MKKLVLLLSSVLLFNTLSGLANNYKIGDSMPNYKRNTKLSKKILIDKKNCPTWIYRYEKKGEDIFSVAHTDISYDRPFAIYDLKSGTLYLDVIDEKENGGHDNKIDFIDKSPKKINIKFYNPLCQLEVFGKKI